jgi:hypothetical protein
MPGLINHWYVLLIFLALMVSLVWAGVAIVRAILRYAIREARK